MSFNYGSKNTNNDNGYEIIGTPFPILETDEIVSRKPEIDQTVRDERGRRRFHGAFTGGFSAGYWNTVGSVEGFTPKIFKSSRKDKYDKTEFISKPEDFMDDEDFGSFGIAPKKIHTKDDFVENFSISSLKDSKMTFDEVIRSVFQPSKESIGKRLYRKMKSAAKLEERQQQQLINHQISVDEKTEKINNNILQFKTNRHGLGYSGMLNTDEIYNESSSLNNKSDKNAVMATLKSGKKLQISGEAFGYGALEDDDAIDIYATDDLSQYDFEIGSKVKKITPKKSLVYNPNSSTVQLDGFVKCKENLNLFSNIKRKYQPPELPKDWKPKNQNSTTKPINKKSRWDSMQKSSTDNPNQSSSQQLDQQPKQKILNSNLRAVILGENIVHKTGIKKEIEFAKEIQKPTPPPPPVPPSQKLSVPVVPALKTPLSGYFASKFTRSSTASATTIGDKPLAAGLNTFETMSMISIDEQKKKNESNETIDSDSSKKPIRTIYEWHPHKILCKRFGVQNPYPQFTDIVGIVCMNDNDKSRNMIARLNANPIKSNSKSSSLFANLFEDLNKTTVITSSNDNCTSVETSKNFAPKVPTVVDDNHDDDDDDDDEISIEEKSLPPKPPIDLFKSIFASDEEDDEDDEETDNNNQVNDSSTNNPKNNTNSSKNYGIFSGIDFDLFEENFKPSSSSATNVNQIDDNNNKSDNEDNDNDDCYGPALPPTITSLSNAEAITSVNLYEKIKSSKHYHHHSKKKKEKKSKRKKSKSSNHKKSNKKRKRTSSASSSSSSSEYIDSPIKKKR